MPKKAPQADAIDPVRSRLAGAVVGPVKRPSPVDSEPTSNGDSTPQATEPEPATPTPPAKPGRRRAASRSQLTVNRKFMVSPEEAEQMEDTLRRISAAFGSKVTYSQVSRALWTILAGKENAFRSSGMRATKRSVPSTGDALGMAEYEEAVTEYLEAALKRS